MIHLLPDTASQTAYFSPFQARKYLVSFGQYLAIFESMATGQSAACILNVFADNDRYTQVDIATNTDDGVAGNVLLKESGLYSYTIYGQNSTINLDPTDVVVVGVCETGMLRLGAAAAWTTPTISVPDNVIYYE